MYNYVVRHQVIATPTGHSWRQQMNSERRHLDPKPSWLQRQCKVTIFEFKLDINCMQVFKISEQLGTICARNRSFTSANMLTLLFSQMHIGGSYTCVRLGKFRWCATMLVHTLFSVLVKSSTISTGLQSKLTLYVCFNSTVDLSNKVEQLSFLNLAFLYADSFLSDNWHFIKINYVKMF